MSAWSVYKITSALLYAPLQLVAGCVLVHAFFAVYAHVIMSQALALTARNGGPRKLGECRGDKNVKHGTRRTKSTSFVCDIHRRLYEKRLARNRHGVYDPRQ